MKKKGKTAGILLGVLAVLLAVFFGLRKWNASQEEAKEKEEAAAAVHIFETGSLTGISYEDMDGNGMDFEKAEGSWKYCPDAAIPLAEDTMAGMEEAFSDIRAVKELEEPDDLEDYGFGEPQYRLALTESGGEEHLFLIGNMAGENYYFTEDGTGKVYTVSADLISQMAWQLSEVAQKESFPAVTESNFVKETVTAPDGSETVYDAGDDEQEGAVSSVTAGYASFYFTDCVDYHVTEASLGNYGLSEPERTAVTVVYQDFSDDSQEKELTFYVGSQDGSGYYYVQLDGSLMVNRVTTDTMEKALGWQQETEEE